MKGFKKLLSIVLIVTLLTGSINASASNIVVRSKHIASYSISFSIGSNGIAACSCTIIARAGTKGITGGLLLYKNNKGGSRTLLNVWHIGTKKDLCFISEPYQLDSHGTYTLVLNANVFRDGETEQICVNRSATW